jgi:hypothetical protein
VSSVYLLFMPSLDLCCKHHLGIRIFQPFDDNNTNFHTARTLDKATFKIDTDRPVLLDLYNYAVRLFKCYRFQILATVRLFKNSKII